MKTNIKNEENNNLNYESLIQRLRSQDAKIIKKNKMMIGISILLVAAWAAMCIFNYDFTYITNDGIFNMFLFILVTLILIYRIFNQLKFKKNNYADSVRSSLYSAEKRYRFWNQKTIFETIMAIIIGIAFGYMLYNRHLESWSELKNIALTIFGPVFILVFSMSRLYMKWKNENKPLWISAKNLLKEFE